MKLSPLPIARSLFLAAVLTPLTVSVSRPVRADEGHPHGPPPEAFAACTDKKTGDSCTVTLRDRTLSGTCTATPDDRVACRPDHMPPPPDGRGPGGTPPNN